MKPINSPQTPLKHEKALKAALNLMEEPKTIETQVARAPSPKQLEICTKKISAISEKSTKTQEKIQHILNKQNLSSPRYLLTICKNLIASDFDPLPLENVKKAADQIHHLKGQQNLSEEEFQGQVSQIIEDLFSSSSSKRRLKLAHLLHTFLLPLVESKKNSITPRLACQTIGPALVASSLPNPSSPPQLLYGARQGMILILEYLIDLPELLPLPSPPTPL